METTTIIDRNSRAFYTDLLGIKTEYYNPNPCQNGNKDEEDRGDYIVRAISKLLDKSWNDVYKDMSEFGLSVGMMIDSKDLIKLYLAKCGYINISDMVSQKGDIVTVGEFMYNYKTGRFIISSLSHATAYIDGVWYDNYDILSTPNYFIVDDHYGIYVNLYDKNFRTYINDSINALKESSEKETKYSKIDKMILEELIKHDLPESCDNEIKVGNIYRDKRYKEIYYLLIDIDGDYGEFTFAIYTIKNNHLLPIVTENNIYLYLFNENPIFKMYRIGDDYELFDTTSNDYIEELNEYLEKHNSEKENRKHGNN